MVKIFVATDTPLWEEIHEIDKLANTAIGAALKTLQATGKMANHETYWSVDCLFTSNQVITEMNAKWRGQNKPTNVLSFPMKYSPSIQPEMHFLGDIVITYETTKKEAALENKLFHHHVTHLVVHGFLHLLGFDHKRESEAQKMEDLERRILLSLDIENPYRHAQK